MKELWLLQTAIITTLFTLSASVAFSATMDDGYKHYKNGDYEKALQIWLMLPDDCLALYNINRLYNKGQGVERDQQKEAEYAIKAAECLEDHPDGKWMTRPYHYAGVHYLLGEGVERNFEKAIYWFKIGARSGNPRDSLNLGSIYRNEFGDLAKAWAFYTLAAEQGGATTDEGEDVKDYADQMFYELSDEEAIKAKAFFTDELGVYRRSCLIPKYC